MAVGQNADTPPPQISGPDDLRLELWCAQSRMLTDERFPVFFDAGEFVLTGYAEDDLSLAEWLPPRACPPVWSLSCGFPVDPPLVPSTCPSYPEAVLQAFLQCRPDVPDVAWITPPLSLAEEVAMRAGAGKD